MKDGFQIRKDILYTCDPILLLIIAGLELMSRPRTPCTAFLARSDLTTQVALSLLGFTAKKITSGQHPGELVTTNLVLTTDTQFCGVNKQKQMDSDKFYGFLKDG